MQSFLVEYFAFRNNNDIFFGTIKRFLIRITKSVSECFSFRTGKVQLTKAKKINKKYFQRKYSHCLQRVSGKEQRQQQLWKRVLRDSLR